MEKIYLIDDQPIANFIMRKLLELEGYEGSIEEFTNAEEALEEIEKNGDALIFLDLNMPGMNGWEFMEDLKTRNLQPNIIILSSSTSKFDKERAKEYSFVLKYMVKPMTKEKFKEVSGFLKFSSQN